MNIVDIKKLVHDFKNELTKKVCDMFYEDRELYLLDVLNKIEETADNIVKRFNSYYENNKEIIEKD